MLFEEFKDSDGKNRNLFCRDRSYLDFCRSVSIRVNKSICVCTDVLGNILKKLTAKRSRARVVDKLLSMGLVSERRELYKKRSRGAKRKSSGEGMVKLLYMHIKKKKNIF